MFVLPSDNVAASTESHPDNLSLAVKTLPGTVPVGLTPRFWAQPSKGPAAPERVLQYGGPFDKASVARFKATSSFGGLVAQFHGHIGQLCEFVKHEASTDVAARLLPELDALRRQIGASDTLDDFHSIPPNLLYKDVQGWLDCIRRMTEAGGVSNHQKLDVLDRMCTGLKNCGDGVANRLEAAACASQLLLGSDVAAYAKKRMVDDLIIAYVNQHEKSHGSGQMPHLVAVYQQALSMELGIPYPGADGRAQDLQVDPHHLDGCAQWIEDQVTARSVVGVLAGDVIQALKQAYETTLAARGDAPLDLTSFGLFFQTEVEPVFKRYGLDLDIFSVFEERQSPDDDLDASMVLKRGDPTAVLLAVQGSLRAEGLIHGDPQIVHATLAEHWVVDGELAYVQSPRSRKKTEPITPDHLARLAPEAVESMEARETIAMHVVSTWAPADLSRFPSRWLVSAPCAIRLFSRMDGAQLRRFVQTHAAGIDELLRQPHGLEVANALAMREMEPEDLRRFSVNLTRRPDRSFLLELVNAGRQRWIEACVKAGANFAFKAPDWPHYPVAMAVQQGNAEMAKLLVSARAVNIFDPKLLRSFDEDVTVDVALDVLKTAARNGNVAVLEAAAALMSGGRSRFLLLPLLSEAAGHGRVEFLKALMKTGCKPGSRDMMAAVTKAVEGGHFEALVYLASQGGLDKTHEINRSYVFESEGPGTKAMPLLHFAAKHGYVDVVQFLLTMGADPKIRAHDGFNALDCAGRHGHMQVVEAISGYQKFKSDTASRPLGT